MLAAAIRIAQRMGLHNESAHTKYYALEAEMRRRLWWSLVLFDARLCEMSDYKTTNLVPTWDCRIPLNLDDFDLQPEMKDLPRVQEKSSEALFAVMRSELGNVVRHSSFHLDFVDPALKILSKAQDDRIPGTGDLTALEKRIGAAHLKYCSLENPLHFMTMWMWRGQFAKCRLMEHYARFPTSSVAQTDLERSAAVSTAQTMLECDTKLISSHFTKGYRWFVDFYFPFPSYIHLVQDLRMRPASNQAEYTWKVMSENYEARYKFQQQRDSPLYRAFTKIVFQAWRAREAVFAKAGTSRVPPRIVSDMQKRTAPMMQEAHGPGVDHVNGDTGTNTRSSIALPVASESDSLYYGTERQLFVGLGLQSGSYPHVLGQTGLDGDWSDMNWTPTDWNPFYSYDWGN